MRYSQYTLRLDLRLDEKTDKKLEELSEKAKLDKSEIVRTLIQKAEVKDLLDNR